MSDYRAVGLCEDAVQQHRAADEVETQEHRQREDEVDGDTRRHRVTVQPLHGRTRGCVTFK